MPLACIGRYLSGPETKAETGLNSKFVPMGTLTRLPWVPGRVFMKTMKVGLVTFIKVQEGGIKPFLKLNIELLYIVERNISIF